jgi:uncharacterized protein with HEPN domain
MRSDEALLLDMLIAARKILRFTKDIDEAGFLQSEMLQSAVLRELQVIGDAARLVTDEAKGTYSLIPWRVIAGMRNRLVHAYFDVRSDVVWQTTQDDIPDLAAKLEQIIPKSTS